MDEVGCLRVLDEELAPQQRGQHALDYRFCARYIRSDGEVFEPRGRSLEPLDDGRKVEA